LIVKLPAPGVAPVGITLEYGSSLRAGVQGLCILIRMMLVVVQRLFVTVIISVVSAGKLAVELVITPAWLFIVTALAIATAEVPLSTFVNAALLKSIAVFDALKEFTVRVMAASSRNERRIC
jgi:hypothetical protein